MRYITKLKQQPQKLVINRGCPCTQLEAATKRKEGKITGWFTLPKGRPPKEKAKDKVISKPKVVVSKEKSTSQPSKRTKYVP